MFVKFLKGNIVNVDAIQFIEPVTLDNLYEEDEKLWRFAMYFLRDIFNENEMAAFGVTFATVANGSAAHRVMYENKKKAAVKGNFVVGYKVHLGAPCGGINNSHETVNISVDECMKLTAMLNANKQICYFD